MRCHSHLPSWYTFTYTHIPGTGMAAVEEAALGKSWVCRWCAGVSAAGAGVWKNPDGTMAAISYVVTSVVCHSPSAALVGTPITSLHFTSHTTGHLHYKPARTSRWLSLNGTYSILWSHKYGYTWIWIIYHIYRRLAAGATYLYRIRHINYNSDKKTILYTGKSYALQISSQRNFSCDVLLVRMYTGLCRRFLTVWRVKNPSSFPITGTGDIDSPKSLTTVPVAKVTLSVP